MSAYGRIYKIADAAGNGIAAAFNWASGGHALDKRGLDRTFGQTVDVIMDGALMGTAGVVGGVLLAAAVGAAAPLTPLFAAAAGVVGLFAPAHIQAAFIIGRNENKPGFGG